MKSPTSRRVAIVGGVRTPFVKSFTTYRHVSEQDLMTAALEALVQQQGLVGQTLGDVALGAVMMHSKDWNFARECVLGTSLNPATPAYNVQRACGTGLETANHIALKIAAGQIEVGIAAGCDTNSDLPVVARKELASFLLDLRDARTLPERLKVLSTFRPAMVVPQFPMVTEPRTGLSMGEHCELMVKQWNIPRQAQDQLAFESHQKGASAYAEGFYKDLVMTFQGIDRDGILRQETSMEKLAKLRPAFDKSSSGTLTAGNSTPLTDGAAAVLLASEDWAKEHGKEPWAYLVDVETAALNFVSGEGLLMAPTVAVSRLLARHQLKLQDFDFYEIHEAFAGQVLCTLKAWEDPQFCREKLGRSEAMGAIDRSKMNLKGGSVAMGHPFAATGGRILAGLAKQLKLKGKGRGLISICTGGGMGIAAIVER